MTTKQQTENNETRYKTNGHSEEETERDEQNDESDESDRLAVVDPIIVNRKIEQLYGKHIC